MWWNRRGEDGTIKSRLDRVLCSPQWTAEFNGASCFHLKMVGADHCPLLLDTIATSGKAKRCFVFDNRWVRKAGCEEVVRKAWANKFWGSCWFQVGEKIKNVRMELIECLGEEEKYWRLKSKEKHLKDGDKNSKFFHISTKLRRRKNLILGMEDSEGTWQIGADNVEAIVLDYFRTIFSANELCDPELVTTHVDRRVIEQ
ncbi:hypothetical protein LIER_32074 [Lithospermum erythrorhizon]|uniref:Uncharacterized protein n=1 Tax=Lithospermum erythrorhizon TaxID=34254 RepID=A0AAV3RY74_LITER